MRRSLDRRGISNGGAGAGDAKLTDRPETGLKTFEVVSGDISNGRLSWRNVCREEGGAELPPSLSWRSAPPGTRSFALIADDPMAFSGKGFTHWVMTDIPADVGSLDETNVGLVGTQGLNGHGGIGYRGACPRSGTGPHSYRFRLHALDVTLQPRSRRFTKAELEQAMQGHVLGTAEIVGRFENHTPSKADDSHLDVPTRRFLARANAPAATPKSLGDALHRASARNPTVRHPTLVYMVMNGAFGGPLRIVLPGPISIRRQTRTVLMYFHGGAWVSGGWGTHGPLARRLSLQTPAVVVFVEYSLSPGARFPVALEQCYAATAYAARSFPRLKLAVAGDSVGGNLAIGVSMLSKARRHPAIRGLAMVCPAVDPTMSSASVKEFADGPWATKQMMADGWSAHLGSLETDELKDASSGRTFNPYVAPLGAGKMLGGLPPTLVITAENDILRDEGETLARKLGDAGVPVVAARFNGTIHGFLDIGALSTSPAANAGIDQLIAFLRRI